MSIWDKASSERYDEWTAEITEALATARYRDNCAAAGAAGIHIEGSDVRRHQRRKCPGPSVARAGTRGEPIMDTHSTAR